MCTYFTHPHPPTRCRSLSPVFGPCLHPPKISRSEQYDRYEAHTKHCTYCQGVLRNALRLKRAAPLTALLGLALGRSPVAKLLAVVTYYWIDSVADKLLRAVNGPVRGEKVSAAQLPTKQTKPTKLSKSKNFIK